MGVRQRGNEAYHKNKTIEKSMIYEWYSQILKDFIGKRCIFLFGKSGKTTWEISIYSGSFRMIY